MIPGSVTPLLLKKAAVDTGYNIERSLRFNSSDSGFCSRSVSSAGNRRTWTFSAWVKRAAISASNNYTIFSSYTDGNNEAVISFSLDSFRVYSYIGAYQVNLVTTPVFRDPSSWYHVLVAFDTTNATQADRVLLYVNGTRITTFSTSVLPSQNYDGMVNAANSHYIGRDSTTSRYFDGLIAECHFIDGQALTPSSFTEVSATTGQLIPKQYTGSFGTNGFWLKFSDNSAATATTLGKDYSGNSNNWSPTNLSVTAGAGNDSLVDTPTSYGTDTGAGGSVRGNYCTWNPLKSTVTLSNGNLDGSAGGGWFNVAGTVAVTSGKWYWEVTMNTSTFVTIGVATPEASLSEGYGSPTTVWVYDGRGTKQGNGSGNAGSGTDTYGASYGAGDVIGVALDMDNGTLTFYKNNTSQGTAFSTGLSGKTITPWHGLWSSSSSANFGQRPFAYTAPSGFKALCDTNLPAPVVAKPNEVMDVALWTGTNGANARTISGLSLSPDLVWIKVRNQSYSHQLFDAVRGTTKTLVSNSTGAEITNDASGTLTAFNSDGFTLSPVTNNNSFNTLNDTYVAWTWDAGSSTVTNTQGSISSQVRANASAGFSIVTYTGTSSSETVGHGLGVAPGLIIVKCRTSGTTDWQVYHSSRGKDRTLQLSATNAEATVTNYWGTTTPSSTVFGIISGFDNNVNGGAHVAYCFAPVAGYSSFGSYTGNGSTDGPFVYTGFRPRWILTKRSSTSGSWHIYDTVRRTYNVNDVYLLVEGADAEKSADNGIDVLSNGFKLKSTNTGTNENGTTIIYAAFAESPFQFSRAR